MFRSKASIPSQPESLWTMQALTLNYLIEGKVKPNDEVRLLLGGGAHYYESRYVLTLTDARVQPTADLNIPDLYIPTWTVEHRGNLVALIPGDEDSLQALFKFNASKAVSYRASFYIGPYHIWATVIQPSPTLSFESYAFMAAKDVEIDCLLPGSKRVGFKKPWMVINREMSQGYKPE